MALLEPLALRRIPRILSIAGTDPTGGAGIHADLKSIAAMGGYGMAVVTALVAQNTRGVRSVHTPPAGFLRDQLDAVSDDVTIDAVKIGMLGDAATIEVVHEWLLRVHPQLVVLDPVMIATSGDRLLAGSAEASMRDLVETVSLVTPNLPELAVLVGAPTATRWPEALDQARRLSAGAATAVLVKGGHLLTDSSPDALVDMTGSAEETFQEFHAPRVSTSNTHGTGCSLSAAVATVMARTGDWGTAISEVKEWLQGALTYADDLQVGEGSGPINHFHHLWPAASPGK
ncbi:MULTISPECIES: bifunctional hydroxymethylpyrimidine kinase/phosphomethylpyrimidine kinase [unclassified Arthrobacter]|uniref:bifunctional hydroxymethylpyrimidine kinase/phosphomethylpyrimidine kinase n=1 Tax=unclassified Arthrobacter TaxID=235627 RepID=UPI00149274E2|nr:bifunctional hydroxymethylpyrimidine kinase/phosphomethylpyrimidine kinase [Arthrobacter sp. AET 35A]MBE0010231.1 bifunctional hydroxymethylpyrimidine kinase/phosphomethylpyrimidine kinase [Arthrobacter sp. AET 35A]NOJ61457.1 bifunctional hydroxymethylpyrimidine kinase/phosphomethylpyrimidine kinase [Arthrobacter sp. 260]NOJ64047.1 bifunctional hydroxymethylpyrimidine kinase/phosphomethylpyrimidine kinase [Arthrobacter sp. 147(2020)]